MRCEQVRGLLHDYLDGTLNRGIADTVAAHLSVCEPCRQEHAFLKRVWHELAHLPETPVPADLHARIMTHVRAHTRARQAQQQVLFWRWMGAGAVAASLLLVAFFFAQSGRGVEAGFGFGKSEEASRTLVPSYSGVHVEWRRLANGESIPVLIAGSNHSATASLIWTADPKTAPRKGQLVWQGMLPPGRTVELLLTPLLQSASERVVVLWWSVDDRYHALFVPVGYPPAQRISLRLNAPLSEALAELASAYQMPIEWVPAEPNRNPKVVLEVQDATLQEALEKLLAHTGYRAQRKPHGWRVVAQ